MTGDKVKTIWNYLLDIFCLVDPDLRPLIRKEKLMKINTMSL